MVLKFRRKAYDELIKWKESSQGSTAMMINGARRVGKTTVAKTFARNEYRSFIILDFANISEGVLQLFKNDSSDLDTFFEKLSVLIDTPLYPRESIIVFDEVQMYPPARQLIKYLVEDGRFDYLETGSLLSIESNVSEILIPSEEETINMYPMDFEEFLWAIGDTTAMPYMRKCFENLTPLGEAVHHRIMNLFRKYILVGGMPQVVETYLTTSDFGDADKKKRDILSLYRKDISKHAGRDRMKVEAVFDTIPSELSKKEKKFNPAAIDKSLRNDDLDSAFLWLVDGMIVNMCINSTDPSVGLSMSLDYSSRKLYMGDTGLLVTMSLSDKGETDNAIYKSVLLDKIGINEGMFAENIVAQALRAGGHGLFFYSRYRKVNADGDVDDRMEVDFLIRRGGKICPIEVKSSGYDTHRSLDKFCEKFKGRLGQPYLLYTKDLRVKDGVIMMPLYMAMLL